MPNYEQNNPIVAIRQDNWATGNVLIGVGTESIYSNCVIIGRYVAADHDNQLKIGNKEVSISRAITDEEFAEMRDIFRSLVGG